MEAPVKLPYFPLMHNSQKTEPVLLYVPLAQSVHIELPTPVAYFPAAHSVHSGAPA